MAKKAPPEKARLAAAALKLAGSQGWAQVTIENLAKATKISVPALKKHASTPQALVALMVEDVTRQALSVKPSAGTPHDLLFDLLMARFDVLQKNRAGVLAIAEAAQGDRALSHSLARASFHAMHATLDAASLSGLARPALASGLMAIYTWAFIVWRRDTSRDMAKTMAALDRGLRLADSLMARIKRRS